MTHIIIGIILLAITIYVHKHTYYKWIEKKVEFPIWLLLVMIGIAFIPYINILVFAGGLCAYFVFIAENDITFKMPKFLKAIVDILNKEI